MRVCYNEGRIPYSERRLYMGSEATMTLQEYLGYETLAEAQLYLIGTLIGYLLVAFLGFKLLKVELVLGGATTGYILGWVLSIYIGDAIPGVNVGMILAIACAIVLALLAVKIYRALIYLCGAMLGAGIGYAIPYYILLELGQDVVGIIVGAILAVPLAIIGAKLFMKFFKGYFIVATSIVGMVCALDSLAMLILPLDSPAVEYMLILGLALSAVAMKVQFKMNKGKNF